MGGITASVLSTRSREQEIKDKYIRKRDRWASRTLKGILLGGAITILSCGALGSNVSTLHQHRYDNEVVTSYYTAQDTLSNLRNARDNLGSYPEISYKQEEIIPKLKDTFEISPERLESLDNVIESLEADLQKIRENTEFKKYQNLEANKIKALGGGIVGGVGLMILSVLSNLYVRERYRRREKEELQALGISE